MSEKETDTASLSADPGPAEPHDWEFDNRELDKFWDKKSAEIVERYESGFTGQGETHERHYLDDPVLNEQSYIRDSFENCSPDTPYPRHLRKYILDLFETDFLDCRMCRSLSIRGWLEHKQTPLTFPVQNLYTYVPDESIHHLLRRERERGYYILFLEDLDQTWQECPICWVIRESWLAINSGTVPDRSVCAPYAKIHPGFGGNGTIHYRSFPINTSRCACAMQRKVGGTFLLSKL